MESRTEAFPRAIVHIDGDAFFASCEQAVDPTLKGKPVITGRERGIASAVSYEAKAFGVRRGMPIYEIRKICPDIIWLSSDYETYSLFSKRMFSIVRRYTPMVEEYGIDECFAELTGLERTKKTSYSDVAKSIKAEIQRELGITFSVGLAPTKVLAKVASKWKKPDGLTAISMQEIPQFLHKLPTEAIWGIGHRTAPKLARHKIFTALDFAQRPEWWIKENVHKPYQELWYELRGVSVLPIVREGERVPYSIGKTKTFTPPSNKQGFLFSQLSKNIENACIKLRRYNLGARRIFFCLRTQDFRQYGHELRFDCATASPNELVKMVEEHFSTVFDPKKLYRATGVVLSDFTEVNQSDLFGESRKVEKIDAVFRAIDSIDHRYGKHTIFLGSSYKAITGKTYHGQRGGQARRTAALFKGENFRQRVGLPYLGEVS